MSSRTGLEVEAARHYFEGTLSALIALADAWGRHWSAARLPLQIDPPLRRTDAVAALLQRHPVKGNHVVDLGCGRGELSLLAARLGAHVVGIDLVERRLAAGRRAAAAAGLASQIQLRCADITSTEIEPSDIGMLVGVIEYYSDLEPLLQRAFRGVRELAIVVDTRGPWWRRMLRRLIARWEGITLVYRAPAEVVAAMGACGFAQAGHVKGASFTAMAFSRCR